jgi:hypothetical protein
VVVVGAGGVLVAGPLLMILFRQKYPRWWFDWNLELTRLSTRVSVDAALLDDRYPSTDEHQAVRLDLRYPDVRNELNRWLPLVKWLLAIPHYIVLALLGLAAFVCVVVAWFAILFTGRYRRSRSAPDRSSADGLEVEGVECRLEGDVDAAATGGGDGDRLA